MADAPDGWLSVTDLAIARGVSKPAISRRVKRLEALGLISTRMSGKTKLVNVAAFERAVAISGDAVREANGRTRKASQSTTSAASDPVLAHSQARRVSILADLAQLALDEKRNKLVAVEEVADAMVKCAGEIVRVLESVPGRAADNAAAVAKDGVQGARAFLKEMVRDVRERLALAMNDLVSGAVEIDDAKAEAATH